LIDVIQWFHDLRSLFGLPKMTSVLSMHLLHVNFHSTAKLEAKQEPFKFFKTKFIRKRFFPRSFAFLLSPKLTIYRSWNLLQKQFL